MIGFKNKYSFSERKLDSSKIISKYPQCIPIICEKYRYSTSAPEIDKHKYLVNYDLTLGQFMSIIRKRLNLAPNLGLYIFLNDFIPSITSQLYHLYIDFKNEDGFLYIEYDVENTFGNNFEKCHSNIINE